MSRAKKQLKRNNMRKNGAFAHKSNNAQPPKPIVKDEDARRKMKDAISLEQYNDAAGLLAELIGKKQFDPETMYLGAYAYFMSGDYKRAVDWIQNTLDFAPNHISARILLARICIMEDQTDKGLSVFDFVLGHYLKAMSDEQKDDAEDILFYYNTTEPEKLEADFPHIAKFLKGRAAKKADMRDSGNLGKESNKPLDALKSLKARIGSIKEEKEPTEPDQGKKPLSAAESLRALKEKLGRKAETVADNVSKAAGTAALKADLAAKEARDGISDAADSAAEATSGIRQRAAELHQDISEAVRKKQTIPPFDTGAKYDEILSEGIGTRAKCHALNSYAGVLYAAGFNEEAERYLDGAMHLDMDDQETIYNMAVLKKEQGDDDTAMKYAARLERTDFMLLRFLKK